MRLYHTGYEEIREPDIYHGRKNADFGQGFYMTADEEFASRWARERAGRKTIMNTYELELEGLKVHRFERDADWFEYIFNNRSGHTDYLSEADVVVGPIANDTIFDTLGIITSGFLRSDEAIRLLLIGPKYEQTVVKTPRAAANLRWISSREISGEEIAKYRGIVEAEEKEYQELFAKVMEHMYGIRMECEIQMDSIEYIEKTPLVSVIIPVYNVSRYLPQCLDSVTGQTYQNLEIVIVDDESTDGSGSICAHYAERDDRIRLIRSENRGISSARNRGLEKISGTFIAFLDSDDWIEPHTIETLVRAARQTDADIVVANRSFEYVGKTIRSDVRSKRAHTYYEQDILGAFAEGKFRDIVWNKLYASACFGSTRFPEGHTYEDVCVTWKLMKSLAENGGAVTVLGEELFHHRVRKSSISHTWTVNNIRSSWRAYLAKYRALPDYQEQLLPQCIESITRMWISYPGYSKKEKENAQKTIREMQAFSKKNIFRIMRGNYSKSVKMTCLLSQTRSLPAMWIAIWENKLRQVLEAEHYILFD